MPFSIRSIAADQHVCQSITLDALARVLPPDLITQVLVRCDAVEQRRRKLSHTAVVLVLISVALHAHLSIDYVLKRAWRSLRLICLGAAPEAPTEPAFIARRHLLGSRPLRELFHAVCRPVATSRTRDAFRFGLRLVAIDGTKEDVANTSDNERVFGRPASTRGPSGFCQLLCVYLAEVGTHVIFDAVVGPWAGSEHAAAHRLLRSVTPEMLVLADRGLYSYNVIEAVRERGAHALIRISASVAPEPVRVLSDGSVLSRIRPTRGRPDGVRRWRGAHQLVRVISYSMTDPTQPGYGERYRVVTTMLDEQAAPAVDVARCYQERWEIELVIDEIDTHQRLAGRPLRSKTPEGVMQEMYALLIAHYCVRALMHEAALKADVAPLRLSFVGALRVIQDAMPMMAIASRRHQRTLYGWLLDDIARERLPERRARAYPRVVRRKVSKFLLKRDTHHNWPQPTVPLVERVQLI